MPLPDSMVLGSANNLVISGRAAAPNFRKKPMEPASRQSGH